MTSTETTAVPSPVEYRLGTGAPAGLWLGLGAARLAVLAAGLLVTVALLGARLGLPTALVPLVLAAAVTLVPVAGRSAVGWAPPAVGHVAAAVSGASSWRAPLPQLYLAR